MFKQRNDPGSQIAAPAIVETPSASGAANDAEAQFAILETPITKLKSIIAYVERPVQPGEDRTKVTLTRGQVLACATFGKMVNIAREKTERKLS